MERIDGEPVLDRPSVRDVEEFFESAGPETRAVWLRLTRRGVEPGSLTADDLVDVGLCFGWVSAVRRAGDEATYLQRYTRRRPRSKWSRLNISKVERLTEQGRMRPGGTAEVHAAQADGRWANPWT
ncbi:MAG: YdeI/OmpD-associated family protein [Nocardioidaceae bacterium]